MPIPGLILPIKPTISLKRLHFVSLILKPLLYNTHFSGSNQFLIDKVHFTEVKWVVNIVLQYVTFKHMNRVFFFLHL